MPLLPGLEKELVEYGEELEDVILSVSTSAEVAQRAVTKAVRAELGKLEMRAGALVPGQDLRARLAAVERKISEALGRSGYGKAIGSYLDVFSTIADRNVSMQRSYNEVEVATSLLTPARKAAFESAKNYLAGAGLAAGYVTPAKYLLMQQVTAGASITEAQKMLSRWERGELTDGRSTAGRQTPNLTRYSTQMARDSVYQFNGTVNELIRTRYGLDYITYVGDIVASTRPLCRHLVGLRRPIALSELDALIARYPEGVIVGTNAENFTVYRGGYNCRHVVLAVRGPKTGAKGEPEKNEPAPAPAPAPTPKPAPKPEPKPAPAKKTPAKDEPKRAVLSDEDRERVADLRKRNAAALEKYAEEGLTFEDSFLAQFDRDITFELRADVSGSYYEPSTKKLVIAKKTRLDNPFYKEKITLHEGGHAYHFSTKIITFTTVDPEFEKFFKAAKKIIRGKEYEIDALIKKKLNDAIYTLDGEELDTIREKASVLRDTLGGLTNGRDGGGHSKTYYSTENKGRMEVFAHSVTVAKLDVGFDGLSPELDALIARMKEYGSQFFE